MKEVELDKVKNMKRTIHPKKKFKQQTINKQNTHIHTLLGNRLHKAHKDNNCWSERREQDEVIRRCNEKDLHINGVVSSQLAIFMTMYWNLVLLTLLGVVVRSLGKHQIIHGEELRPRTLDECLLCGGTNL